MRFLRTLSLLLVAALALGAAAHAGETGSISGVVKDAQGGVLPGVTVRISGDTAPRRPRGRHHGERQLPVPAPAARRVQGRGRHERHWARPPASSASTWTWTPRWTSS